MGETGARLGGEAAFRDVFTPKLLSALREGYGFNRLRADALAGLTVAIVALPPSMAIAIASGTTPAAGLYPAMVALRAVIDKALYHGATVEIHGAAQQVRAVLTREGIAALWSPSAMPQLWHAAFWPSRPRSASEVA